MDRNQMSVRIGKVGEDTMARELRALSPAERLGIMWQLTIDAWAFKGDPIAESRLQRHVVRLLRGEG